MNRLSKIFRLRRSVWPAPWFLLTLGMTGCGMEPETLQTLQQAAKEVSAGLPPNQLPTAIVDSEADSYQPLYPDRADPFSFPSSNGDSVEARPTSSAVAEQYRVLGFAEVDQPRVLMQIEGEVFSLGVGQFVGGMEIVEIEPPAVRLRSGDLTWTATMFDRQSDK